jgi:hypothetical protein
MAFLSFQGAQAPINLADQSLVEFDQSLTRQDDFWRFTNDGGHDVEVVGQGFAFDQSNRPIAGIVNEVRLDINGNFGPRDVVISGLSVGLNNLDDSPAAFWDTVLEGNDVLDVRGLDSAIVGVVGGSVVFGDSLESRRSQDADIVTDRGGNDEFRTGDGAYALIGDAHIVAGDQRLEAIPAQPGTGTKPPVSGGIVTITEFARYEAGNDAISGEATSHVQKFIGDAFAVLAHGTLIGGDDRLSIASTNRDSIAIGDAFSAGGAAINAMATVIGGDDEITGLNPIGAGASLAKLVGDVNRIDDFAIVIGGGDTIAGPLRLTSSSATLAKTILPRARGSKVAMTSSRAAAATIFLSETWTSRPSGCLNRSPRKPGRRLLSAATTRYVAAPATTASSAMSVRATGPISSTSPEATMRSSAMPATTGYLDRPAMTCSMGAVARTCSTAETVSTSSAMRAPQPA